jgi:hypothetical protein
MNGAYPRFKHSYTHEELVEHFLLTPADLHLVLDLHRTKIRTGRNLVS